MCKDDTFHQTGAGAVAANTIEGDVIGFQQNNYTSYRAISLSSSKSLDLKVFENFINKIIISHILLGSVLTSPFLVVSFIYLLKLQPDIFEFFYAVCFSFFMLTIFLVGLMFFLRFISSQTLVLNDNCIELKRRKNSLAPISYSEIGNVFKLKDLLGYSIYIYTVEVNKPDEIYPYIEFNVESLHVANFIEELIINKRSKNKEEEKEKDKNPI